MKATRTLTVLLALALAATAGALELSVDDFGSVNGDITFAVSGGATAAWTNETRGAGFWSAKLDWDGAAGQNAHALLDKDTAGLTTAGALTNWSYWGNPSGETGVPNPESYFPNLTFFLNTGQGNPDARELVVNTPSGIADKYQAMGARFGPEAFEVTADVVYAEPPLADGPITNDVAGKIALIDRGGVAFSLKVARAQDAGAVGVIIANTDDSLLVMGAGDRADEVTIPSLLVRKSVADDIKANLAGGVNATLTSTVTLLPDYDVTATIWPSTRTWGVDPVYFPGDTWTQATSDQTLSYTLWVSGATGPVMKSMTWAEFSSQDGWSQWGNHYNFHDADIHMVRIGRGNIGTNQRIVQYLDDAVFDGYTFSFEPDVEEVAGNILAWDKDTQKFYFCADATDPGAGTEVMSGRMYFCQGNPLTVRMIGLTGDQQVEVENANANALRTRWYMRGANLFQAYQWSVIDSAQKAATIFRRGSTWLNTGTGWGLQGAGFHGLANELNWDDGAGKWDVTYAGATHQP